MFNLAPAHADHWSAVATVTSGLNMIASEIWAMHFREHGTIYASRRSAKTQVGLRTLVFAAREH